MQKYKWVVSLVVGVVLGAGAMLFVQQPEKVYLTEENLVEKLELNKPVNDEGKTPLHLAVYRGDLEKIQILLSLGADPCVRDEAGNTPLHLAFHNPDWYNCDVEISSTELILRRIRLLFKNGANPNVKNKEGTTPLYLALDRYHKDYPEQARVIEILLEHGADLHEKDERGSNLFMRFASSYKGWGPIHYLLDMDGIDLNATDNDGRSALHNAATIRDGELVKFLLEKKVDVNKADKKNQTPLHVAAWQGRSKVVEMLLEAGADPNPADKVGLTPLHMAAMKGNKSVVTELLKHGADIEKKDTRGATALYYAEIGRYDWIIKLLKQET